MYINSFEEKFYNEIIRFFFEEHGIPILFPPSLFMTCFCGGKQINLFEVLERDVEIDDLTSRKYYQYNVDVSQFEEVSPDIVESQCFEKIGAAAVKTLQCKNHKRAYRISLLQSHRTLE